MRKYCSQECCNAAHSYAGSEKQVEPEEICLPPSLVAREKALEMHAAGLEGPQIAEAVGCCLSTVRWWLRASKKQKTATPQHRPFSEPYFRYIHARSAAEWLAVLNDEMRNGAGYVYTGEHETQERSVVLVCGTIYLTKSLYGLVGVVEYELGLNPTDGSTYVLCNPERNRLKSFRWDGTGFQLSSRQRSYGSYVWPFPRLGRTVAVTALEFEFILYGSQQKTSVENR